MKLQEGIEARAQANVAEELALREGNAASGVDAAHSSHSAVAASEGADVVAADVVPPVNEESGALTPSPGDGSVESGYAVPPIAMVAAPDAASTLSAAQANGAAAAATLSLLMRKKQNMPPDTKYKMPSYKFTNPQHVVTTLDLIAPTTEDPPRPEAELVNFNSRTTDETITYKQLLETAIREMSTTRFVADLPALINDFIDKTGIVAPDHKRERLQSVAATLKLLADGRKLTKDQISCFPTPIPEWMRTSLNDTETTFLNGTDFSDRCEVAAAQQTPESPMEWAKTALQIEENGDHLLAYVAVQLGVVLQKDVFTDGANINPIKLRSAIDTIGHLATYTSRPQWCISSILVAIWLQPMISNTTACGLFSRFMIACRVVSLEAWSLLKKVGGIVQEEDAETFQQFDAEGILEKLRLYRVYAPSGKRQFWDEANAVAACIHSLDQIRTNLLSPEIREAALRHLQNPTIKLADGKTEVPKDQITLEGLVACEPQCEILSGAYGPRSLEEALVRVPEWLLTHEYNPDGRIAFDLLLLEEGEVRRMTEEEVQKAQASPTLTQDAVTMEQVLVYNGNPVYVDPEALPTLLQKELNSVFQKEKDVAQLRNFFTRSTNPFLNLQDPPLSSSGVPPHQFGIKSIVAVALVNPIATTLGIMSGSHTNSQLLRASSIVTEWPGIFEDLPFQKWWEDRTQDFEVDLVKLYGFGSGHYNVRQAITAYSTCLKSPDADSHNFRSSFLLEPPDDYHDVVFSALYLRTIAMANPLPAPPPPTEP